MTQTLFLCFLNCCFQFEISFSDEITTNNEGTVNCPMEDITTSIEDWPQFHQMDRAQWQIINCFLKCCLCLVHLLSQNLVWAYSIFFSMLNFLCILKMILVYSKVRFYYINWLIWVHLKCFEHSWKIWVYQKI